MIHALRFSNFFSFADETELSFVLDSRGHAGHSSVTSELTSQRLSKLLAVVGANGAGKTNAIKPLVFLSWFISSSFFNEPNQPLFVQPHLLGQDRASRFELDFEVGAYVYRYKLHVVAERVLFESLSLKTSRLYTNLFTRSWDEASQSEQIRAPKFGLPAKQAQRVKSNASLISTAVQYGVPIALGVADALSDIWSNVDAYGRLAFRGARDVLGVTPFYAENENYRTKMATLLKQWDFGLDDVVLETHLQVGGDGKEKAVVHPYGVHRAGDREMRLPLMVESSGTQAAYVLLSRLLPALSAGGLVVIDELESDLHPLMLEPILELFTNPHTNPFNAQLVFTCHSVEVLNLLQKGQIMLVEKNAECKSEAWRLSDMEGVRADDNFYAKYMAGTYGAVPSL